MADPKENYDWLRSDINEIKGLLKEIYGKINNHETRISHLEAFMKWTIPTVISIISIVIGVFIGRL